jgi:hypothetical protein
MKRAITIVVAFLVLAGVVSMVFVVRRQMAIDSCLDKGGRWHHEQATCETG